MDYKVTVIGAGVVGLAVSRELSDRFDNVLIIDQEESFGRGISSRNSEVVHSGLYYKQNSLKADLCIKGQRLLYNYCTEKSIPHNICGKLIVAQGSIGKGKLKKLLANAERNGVQDGKLCNKDEIIALEPHVNGEYGLYFPRSGVVDSHQFMLNLEHDSKGNGVDTVYKVEVKKIKKIKGGYELLAMDADENEILFTTETVVNSAGLGANDISTMAGINDPDYTLQYWKGEYFSVGNGKEKFVSRLIYPVPEQNNVGLGIHTTTDISGRLKLGPNAFYLEDGKDDYSVDGSKKKVFYNAVKDFLPFIEMDDLNPDYSGIRPKLQSLGKGEQDFIIVNEAERGYKNFINLIGIESPGLTASMAIAEYVGGVII